MTDQQAERMADAYNLGIKADALREFADHLDAVEPYVPMTARTISADARVKAADLDARAEALALAAESAPPAELTEAQRYCGCDCVNCSGCLGCAAPEQDGGQAEGGL